jgi:hypothetical protein
MPLKHVRICERCAVIRWAPCSITCRVPSDQDRDSWLPNLQDDAGTMPKGPVSRIWTEIGAREQIEAWNGR